MAQLIKTWNGLAIASLKTWNGLAIASVKTINGLDNTAGGGGGSFTFVQSASGVFAGSNPYRSTFAGNTTVGSLIVYAFCWEGASGSGNVAAYEDVGLTKPFTMLTRQDAASGDLHVQIGYIIAGTEANTQIWYTLPSGASQHTPVAMEFTYTGTVTLDQTNLTATGSGTSFASNNITTTGSVELVLGFVGSYSSGHTFSARQIGGVNATGSVSNDDNKNTLFYRQATGTINATATGTASDTWITQIISFKAD